MKPLKNLTNNELWLRWKKTFEALGDPLPNPHFQTELDKVEDEIIERMKAAKSQQSPDA